MLGNARGWTMFWIAFGIIWDAAMYHNVLPCSWRLSMQNYRLADLASFRITRVMSFKSWVTSGHLAERAFSTGENDNFARRRIWIKILGDKAHQTMHLIQSSTVLLHCFREARTLRFSLASTVLKAQVSSTLHRSFSCSLMLYIESCSVANIRQGLRRNIWGCWISIYQTML